LESLYYIIGVCIFMFFLYYVKEIISIKKDLNKLKGIVNHLLKDK